MKVGRASLKTVKKKNLVKGYIDRQGINIHVVSIIIK